MKALKQSSCQFLIILIVGVFTVFRGSFEANVRLTATEGQQHENSPLPRQDEIPLTSTSDKVQSPPSSIRRGMKFINYTSSLWEKIWLDQISELQGSPNKICELMGQQSDFSRRFLRSTCTHFSTYDTGDWCQIQDGHQTFWFHLRTGELRIGRNRVPTNHKKIKFGPEQVVRIADDELFSRFYFQQQSDGAIHVEYIEPLVGVLRHPLACCEHTYRYNASVMGGNHGPFNESNNKCHNNGLHVSRGHYIPPNQTLSSTQKAYYFDAGASHWNKGKGGPSLSFFHHVWDRQGMPFDSIYAFEAKTPNATFYESIPSQYRSMVHYKQTYVRSSPDGDTGPFLPHEIRKLTKKDDYVLFKLDIDSPGVEEGNIDYLLSSESDIMDYVDEFFYEFHSDELSKWYKVFLKMRMAGVRAHSWI